jgi:hypothetical protein
LPKINHCESTHVFQTINQIREFHTKKQNILEYPKAFQLMIYFPSQNRMISVWGNPLGTVEKQIIPQPFQTPRNSTETKTIFYRNWGVLLVIVFLGTCVINDFSKIWQNKK